MGIEERIEKYKELSKNVFNNAITSSVIAGCDIGLYEILDSKYMLYLGIGTLFISGMDLYFGIIIDRKVAKLESALEKKL